MTVAIATRPLVVQYGDERPQRINIGELVPRFDEWADGPRNAVIDTEKVVLITEPEIIADAVASVPEFRDELIAALKERGYRVTKGKTD